MPDEEIRSATQLKLHTREVEGRLGGHVWAKKWAAYLDLALKTRHEVWWNDAYVVRLVASTLGTDACDALLAWKRDGEHYTVVNARYRRHNQGWLGIQADRAVRIARHVYRDLYQTESRATPGA